MYENSVGVVAIGTVQEHWDGITQRPAIYYQPGDDGFEFEHRITVEWFLDLSEIPIGVNVLRERIGYNPLGAVRRIVARKVQVEQIIEECKTALSVLPEGVAKPESYVEGATRKVSVNAYERSHDAVLKCKAVHGTACVICGFDFGVVNGKTFAGFIHVHHLRPLSEIRSEYVVDPVADLCPVCPNCHAVIHHGGLSRSVEEVRQLLSQRK